jgi:5'-3' exonuclease
MGIPSYCRKILENHPSTHFWKDDMEVDNLFIDFNSMIYGVIPEVDIKLDIAEFENVLIGKIIARLQHVICNVVKPKKMVYIAADGTPPRAKMVQQRSRRYKTLKETNFIKDIERKYKMTVPMSKWNKSSISPGTTFMIKLSKIIIKSIQANNLNTNKKITIIFSDDSIPGEGEHKLLPNLRRLKNSGDTSVIYSPDADLIVLSIMSGIEKIFILREPRDSDIEKIQYANKEFLYLDIDVCKIKFNESIGIDIDANSKERILVDYSFLTFLCGNDFVTSIPFLKVKEGGIDTLIDIYKTIFEEISQFLIDRDMSINYIFLIELLKNLASIEEEQMKKLQRKRNRVRQGLKPEKEDSREPWEIEIARFSHEEYYSPLHPHYEIFNKVFNKIDYYNPAWNEQYNNHFFPGCKTDDVCLAYLKSLNFCINYYHKGTPSWSWYYPYRNSPSVKDLSEYLIKNISNLDTKIVWSIDRPYSQYEHLMMILPRQSFKLLPRSLEVDKELEQYYPKNFILDIVAGSKFIYSEPILPDIPIEKIREKIEKVDGKFSFLEKERNILRSRPYVYKN